MSVYFCNECGCSFVEPQVIKLEDFYGVGGEFPYSEDGFIDLCPYCESNDIEEQIDIYQLMEEDA